MRLHCRLVPVQSREYESGYCFESLSNLEIKGTKQLTERDCHKNSVAVEGAWRQKSTVN